MRSCVASQHSQMDGVVSIARTNGPMVNGQQATRMNMKIEYFCWSHALIWFFFPSLFIELCNVRFVPFLICARSASIQWVRGHKTCRYITLDWTQAHVPRSNLFKHNSQFTSIKSAHEISRKLNNWFDQWHIVAYNATRAHVCSSCPKLGTPKPNGNLFIVSNTVHFILFDFFIVDVALPSVLIGNGATAAAAAAAQDQERRKKQKCYGQHIIGYPRPYDE